MFIYIYIYSRSNDLQPLKANVDKKESNEKRATPVRRSIPMNAIHIAYKAESREEALRFRGLPEKSYQPKETPRI